MRLIKFALLVVVVAVGARCMPDPLSVEDLNAPETRIVVSSMILPDSSVCILLTKSISALEADEKSDPQKLIASIAINDAEVKIISDDVVYPLVFVQDGVYQTEDMPVIDGRTYTLHVTSAAYGQVTSTTVAQAAVAFREVDAWLEGKPPHRSAHVAYALHDPAGVNYYVLNVQEKRRQDLPQEILQADTYARIVEDTEMPAPDFSDSFKVIDDDFLPGDTLEVSLSSVSSAYYKYVKLRLESDLELVELFSEPIYYPTNIEGGRGYFNLHWTDVRIIVI